MIFDKDKAKQKYDLLYGRGNEVDWRSARAKERQIKRILRWEERDLRKKANSLVKLAYEEAREKQYEKMLTMYLNGNNLDQVGVFFGVTRERIRQILGRFPEYYAEIRYRKAFISSKIPYTYICKYCKKECTRLLYPNARKPTKCKSTCPRPLEDKRRMWNMRTRRYYHEVLKKRPDWKNIQHTRNTSPKQKAWVKEWMRRKIEKIHMLAKDVIREAK